MKKQTIMAILVGATAIFVGQLAFTEYQKRNA